MDLVLATQNKHKIREMRLFLKPIKGLEIYTLADFPGLDLPPESGTSFGENAKIKAEYVAKVTGKLSLGEDSGLVVPALNGAPGVYSARYAGLNASEKDNRTKLLKEMSPLKDDMRFAYFQCSLVLASPEGYMREVVGLCEGRIIKEERGGNGFGYDSLFIKNDYNKTFAQLHENVKNQVSHRAKALEKMSVILSGLIT